MARRLGQSVLLTVAGIALSIGAQAQAPAAAAAPQAAQDLAPIAFVPFGGTDPMAADKVKGQIEVEGGKAILASSGEVTAGTHAARVQLTHRGELHLCPTTTVALAAANPRTDDLSGLMLSLSRGALEARYQTGRNADLILTPDFRGRMDRAMEILKAAPPDVMNHNLETARSFFTKVVTTHTWEERWDTLRMVRDAGMEVCCGGILGMGETLEQRAEFAAELAELDPHEVPLNFLNPRPGTPFGDLEVMPAAEALRAVAAFRLALPRTMLRFAGGREITLGDLGAKQGILGGINAVIVGNYLTTLGRPAESDLELLSDLQMPIKALNASL